ncbi:MAG: metal-dependent hydrolase [Burkholderiales bacterium]|nr:metal-dependent hydrolase [Burkholderiales bacterium]ODU71166.1 MAG: hydrolase [Lautropia sp. SCN 66-9]
MDSVSQFALGAALSVAVMGRRTSVWKAALWGGVCATLPDLDAFIDHGDPISNVTLHRAQSHSLFYLSLLAPLLAWPIARLHGEGAQWRRWWLALWLALVTHPLLDLMTVYGTQLARPFTDHPYAVGSIFIIDPLYTLPLLIGLAITLSARSPRRLRWNQAGLALSTAYLAWSLIAQQHVIGVARQSLQAQGLPAGQLLVTPTAFNTVLWRVLAVTPDGYVEGFHSLLDGERRIAFEHFHVDPGLYGALKEQPSVARIAWFSQGFFKLAQAGTQVSVTDLRMGQEPYYSFNFIIAQQRAGDWVAVPPRFISQRVDIGAGLRWLWRRMLDASVPPFGQAGAVNAAPA